MRATLQATGLRDSLHPFLRCVPMALDLDDIALEAQPARPRTKADLDASAYELAVQLGERVLTSRRSQAEALGGTRNASPRGVGGGSLVQRLEQLEVRHGRGVRPDTARRLTKALRCKASDLVEVVED